MQQMKKAVEPVASVTPAPVIADAIARPDVAETVAKSETVLSKGVIAAVNILKKAKAIIGQPEWWSDHALHEHSAVRQEGKFCMLGALRHAAKGDYGDYITVHDPEAYEAQEALKDAVKDEAFEYFKATNPVHVVNEHYREGGDYWTAENTIPTFNDGVAANRWRHADVMRAFDKAIEALERKS